MNTTPFEMVQREVRETYDRIWRDWFAGSRLAQAELRIVANGNDAPGYSPSKNLIYLPVCDGDIDEYAACMSDEAFAEREKWRIWKQALVHEMLHEYEDKMLTRATADGIRLRNAHKMVFDPKDKHGDLFYTAIAEKAAHFGLTQEQFRDRL